MSDQRLRELERKWRDSGSVEDVGRPQLQVDVGRVLELHRAGSSLRAIARATGLSRTVVTRVVRQAA